MDGAVFVAHVRVNDQIARPRYAHKAPHGQETVVLIAYLPFPKELYLRRVFLVHIALFHGLRPGGVGAVNGEDRAPAYFILLAIVPLGILVVLGQTGPLHLRKLPAKHVKIVADQLGHGVVRNADLQDLLPGSGAVCQRGLPR